MSKSKSSRNAAVTTVAATPAPVAPVAPVAAKSTVLDSPAYARLVAAKAHLVRMPGSGILHTNVTSGPMTVCRTPVSNG